MSEPKPEKPQTQWVQFGRGRYYLRAVTCSDSWEAITAEHARITFWRDAWAKANSNRKPPYLQTTQEYIERRWDRANRRMKRIMDRADAYLSSQANSQDQENQ